MSSKCPFCSKETSIRVGMLRYLLQTSTEDGTVSTTCIHCKRCINILYKKQISIVAVRYPNVQYHVPNTINNDQGE